MLTMMLMHESYFEHKRLACMDFSKAGSNVHMDLQVMTTRKGLRNQFRSFLGIRKSGSAGGLSPEPASRSGAATGRYDASTQEFQLRSLADAAFMLQVWIDPIKCRLSDEQCVS